MDEASKDLAKTYMRRLQRQRLLTYEISIRNEVSNEPDGKGWWGSKTDCIGYECSYARSRRVV